MDNIFIMAYICVYFVCMEHTFIVVLLECFVALYIFLFKKALSSTSFANRTGLNIAVYKSH